MNVTLDDLLRLAYFGGPVTLRVIGTHDTRHEAVYEETAYDLEDPGDCAELKLIVEELRTRHG